MVRNATKHDHADTTQLLQSWTLDPSTFHHEQRRSCEDPPFLKYFCLLMVVAWKGYLLENGVASGERARKRGFRGKGRGITRGNVGKCIHNSLYLYIKLKKSLNIQKVQTYIQKISVVF